MPIDFWLWEIQSILHAYFNSSDNDNLILTSKSVAKINIGKLMCFITSCSLIASSYTTLSVIRLSSLSQDNRTRVHSQLSSWYSHLSDMQITLGILFIKKILFTKSSWNIRWMNPHKSYFSLEITWEPGQLDLAQEWMRFKYFQHSKWRQFLTIVKFNEWTIIALYHTPYILKYICWIFLFNATITSCLYQQFFVQ